MSAAANLTTKMFEGYDSRQYSMPLQSVDGTKLLPTMWRQIIPVGAGTFILPNMQKGQVVLLDVQGSATIVNAAGTTISTFASGDFVEVTSVSASGTFRYRSFRSDLQNGKFTTSAAASGVVPTGAVWSGAREVYWQNTTDGAMAVTTPTAADIIAALATAGQQGTLTYFLIVANRGDNTVTLTGGDGVTITGEATIATLVTRRYLVTVNAFAGTVGMRSVDKGTIET